MAKKQQKKWNRVHFFVKEHKPNVKDKKEHPGYAFEQSKTHYKVIMFTHHPTTNGKDNVPLKHNIDPEEKDRKSYAIPYKNPRPREEFKSPDKKYRIHSEDRGTINSLKYNKK